MMDVPVSVLMRFTRECGMGECGMGECGMGEWGMGECGMGECGMGEWGNGGMEYSTHLFTT